VSIYHIIFAQSGDGGGDETNATYATARAGTAALSNTGITALNIGQSFSTPNYIIRQYLGNFDTSAVPAGGGTAEFIFNVSTGTASLGDTWELREVSAISNKIAGASLSGFTQLGSLAVPSSTGSKTIVIPDISSLSRDATCSLCMHSQRERNNTAPSAAEWAGINTADVSGTTNDPVLTLATGSLWQFVGVGNVVEVTGTSHALLEPAGVASGDLLVACISSRIASTTQVTLPTGGEWTLVGDRNNNNTATNTSATPSGTMAYCIRGGSAPNLTFTHPIAPSVAIGTIVAYRNAAQTSTLDDSNDTTTSTNITAISSAVGVTTTQDDDLLVIMRAGGQESTLTGLAAATDPTSASGATNTSSHPAPNAWLERLDATTTTGADTALTILDAVKTAAGSTGNITATASAASAHVLVHGAFKIVAATNKSIDADAGSYSVTGTTTGTQLGRVVGADAGSYAVSGTDATLSKGLTLGADAGSYSVSGQDVTFNRTYVIGADAGSYAVTGTDAGLFVGYAVTADAGSYSVSGTDADLELISNKALDADAGSYSVSGTDATFNRTYVIGADAGSYTVSGTDSALSKGLTVGADSGSYAVNGTDAALEHDRQVTADAGSYSVSGTDAGLYHGWVVSADSGSYSVSGTDATFDRSYAVIADAGSYSVSGTDADPLHGWVLNADAGSYAVSGTDADLTITPAGAIQLDADAGSYAVFGDDVDLLLDRLIVAGDGSYVITGGDADLVYDPGSGGNGVDEWIIQTNRRRHSPHRRI
jgi:hypothetical protein